MRVVVASDSFKGSLSSRRITEIITDTARRISDEITVIGIPIADGGEGTLDAILSTAEGELIETWAHDPLGRAIRAKYALLADGRAVIEMAQASGLTLITDKERNPLKTSTYGTGELIRDALDHRCRDLVVTVGGSATNDGGMGCMRALGVRYFDASGVELSGNGEDLIRISRIDASGLMNEAQRARFTVMCDVTNPLCGEYGATRTYGPQKGASDGDIEILEKGMCNLRDLINEKYGVDCDDVPGSGAAGGLGAALHVFLNGRIRSGIDTLLDLADYEGMIRDADLVITGEGQADSQSLHGKAMSGVAIRAKALGIPVVAICGSVDESANGLREMGINSLYETKPADMPLSEAMNRAEELYLIAAEKVLRERIRVNQ